MVERRALLLFFPLAFLLSWYPYLLGKTHLVKTSGGINPLGPMVAALIVAAIFYGKAGFKELLGRYARWRIGWGPLAFALLFPAVVAFLAAALNIAAGAARPVVAELAPSELMSKFIFILLFVGVGEETGWRGFALPELQKRLSPVVASLVLGAIWAAWHIPLFGVEFAPAVIPWFLLSVLAGAVMATWLFNAAHGSLLPLPVFHAMVNTVGAGFVFPMFKDADLIRLWWIYAALWALAAVGFAAFSADMKPKPKLTATPA
jgi:membrane protease YdiL (CAAX protease family)